MQVLTDWVIGGNLWPFVFLVMAVGVQYLKPQEVADRLQISKWQAYRLIKRGLIPVVRLGRSVRVPEDALTPDALRTLQKLQQATKS